MQTKESWKRRRNKLIDGSENGMSKRERNENSLV